MSLRIPDIRIEDGGTGGWMTAAALACFCLSDMICVGEATIQERVNA